MASAHQHSSCTKFGSDLETMAETSHMHQGPRMSASHKLCTIVMLVMIIMAATRLANVEAGRLLSPHGSQEIRYQQQSSSKTKDSCAHGQKHTHVQVRVRRLAKK